MECRCGCMRCLTFELSGRQRQDDRARPVRMLCVQQAGHWRPADGAPLERGVMHQPTPSRKVHFPGLARRTDLRQTTCTAASNTKTAATPKPARDRHALSLPAQRTGWLPADRPGHRCSMHSDRRATPPPDRQHAASAAGPTNMTALRPRSNKPPGQEQPGALSLPDSTRGSALLHQRFKNPHSRLFWISASGGDPGLFF